MKILLLIVIAVIVWQVIKRFPLRLGGNGFKYVYVKDDGSVRDLYLHEEEYIYEKFEPGDGNRPYIKSYYWKKTPDKKIRGFLKRIRVPWWIKIEPVENINHN